MYKRLGVQMCILHENIHNVYIQLPWILHFTNLRNVNTADVMNMTSEYTQQILWQKCQASWFKCLNIIIFLCHLYNNATTEKHVACWGVFNSFTSAHSAPVLSLGSPPPSSTCNTLHCSRWCTFDHGRHSRHGNILNRVLSSCSGIS